MSAPKKGAAKGAKKAPPGMFVCDLDSASTTPAEPRPREAQAVALIHPEQLAAFDRAWRTAVSMLGELATGAHDEQALPLCTVFGALTTLGAIVNENTTTLEHAGRDLEALGNASATGGAS